MAKRSSDSAILRTLALDTLAITENQLRASPQITPQLRMIGMTLRRAGQPRVTLRTLSGPGRHGPPTEEITHHATPYGMGTNLLTSWPAYLQTVEDPDAIQVLGAWAQLPSHLRSSVPVEAFCVAASVSPVRVLELITLACVRLGAQASSIIAAVNHPRVVEKTVEMALTDGGIEDRLVLHKATGFLPTAKGPSVVVHANSSSSSTATAQAVALPAPPPESTIRRMVDRFNDARPVAALPPADVVTIPSTVSARTLDVAEEDRQEYAIIDADAADED